MSLDLGLLEVESRDNREPREQDVHTMAQNFQASSKRKTGKEIPFLLLMAVLSLPRWQFLICWSLAQESKVPGQQLKLLVQEDPCCVPQKEWVPFENKKTLSFINFLLENSCRVPEQL